MNSLNTYDNQPPIRRPNQPSDIESLHMININIDFKITKRLIELFAESTACKFVGDPNNLRGEEWASEELEKVADTGIWHGFNRLGIMKISYADELVGWAMPRMITPQEYDKLLLPRGVSNIHRIGTIYITPEHRGKGIARTTMQMYTAIRPHQVWLADPENTGSQHTALSCGLKRTGQIYFGEDKSWKHEPFDGYKSSRIIYSLIQ